MSNKKCIFWIRKYFWRPVRQCTCRCAQGIYFLILFSSFKFISLIIADTYQYSNQSATDEFHSPPLLIFRLGSRSYDVAPQTCQKD